MNVINPTGESRRRRSLVAGRGLAVILGLGLLLAQASAQAQATGHRSLTFDLPADLLAAAVTDAATDSAFDERPRQILWLLLAGDGGPPTLHRLDSGVWDRGIETLELALDAEVNELAAATSADDNGETACRLLVGKPGVIFELPIEAPDRPAAALVQRLAGPGVELTARPRPSLTGFVPSMESWPLVSVGSLELRNLSAGDGVGRGVEEAYPLPVDARRSGLALRLTSPPVSALQRAASRPGMGPGMETLFVAGPEAFGERRLRTLLLNPSGAKAFQGTDPSHENSDGAEPSDEPLAAWSQLPDPEEVAEAWFALMDGRPRLLVSTFRTDRVGIFDSRQLRLFPLEPDRRRAGRPPVLAVGTASRRWQALGPAIADLDDDGQDDLLLLQPKGLEGDELLAEAYTGDGRGGFSRRPRRSVLPVASDGIWQFGDDLDGDGRGDLVVLGQEGLAAFAGIAHRHRRRVFASEPLWRLPVTASASSRNTADDDGPGEAANDRFSGRQPRLFTLDLDGDGRREAILLAPKPIGTSGGGTHVLVVATSPHP